MTDYYQILGVDRNASTEDIKKAYRRLASKHHPDRAGGDKGKFQEIEQAYRILSDPQQRQAYDNPQPDFGGFQFNQGGFDFDSIFDIFGARFGQQQRRPNYARMTLWISLYDAATGGRRTVSVGTHTGTSMVEIDIPLGIEDGQGVQYSGLAPGGGDLIIQFRIHPNHNWQRNGQHLITEQTVSVWDLILGKEIEITDIRNDRFLMNIPARTQPGTMLRMRGRGMPDRNGNRGDLLVRVNAQIPQNIPNEIIQAIEQNTTK